MQHQLEILKGKTNLTQVSITTIFAYAIKSVGNAESFMKLTHQQVTLFNTGFIH